MNGTVSVIMPSYNTAAYIARSIESVLAQTYTDWELVIVDDCSTDQTDEIVKPYLSDERIKYIKNDTNVGAAMSRNRAIRSASGRWIAFLDSDDVWLPEKLEKQLCFMEDHQYAFSYTAYDETDDRGIKNGVTVFGPQKVSKRGMYHYCWPGCLTVMYDAEVIGLVQIEDIKKNNDYAMWVQIVKKAPCYFYPESLALYTKHEGSISSGSKWKLIKHHYIMWRVAEHRSVVASAVLTVRNLFWGVVKKCRYCKAQTIGG